MDDRTPWSAPLPPPEPRLTLPPPLAAPPRPVQLERDRRAADRVLVTEEPAAPGPVSRGRSRRGWWWLIALLGVVAVIVGIVLARDNAAPTDTQPSAALPTSAAAGSSAPTVLQTVGEPVATPPVTEPSTPSTPVIVDITEASPPVTLSPETTSPETSVAGTPWPNGVVLTVATSGGARLVSALGETPLNLAPAERSLSFADGPGIGVMYQPGPFAAPGVDPTDIVRVRPDGRQLILYPANRGEVQRLHDLRVVDGRPEILYSARRGSTPDDEREVLFLARPVEARNIELGEIGGWESGTGRLQFGGDLIVGEAFAEVTGAFFAITTSGQPGPPAAFFGIDEVSVDCEDCPHHFTINAAGTQLGWIANNEFVLVDRVTGAQVTRVPLADGTTFQLSDVQLGDGIIVLNYSTGTDTPLPATVIDFRGDTPVYTVSPLAGYADLT